MTELTAQFLLGCDACGGDVERIDDTICDACRKRAGCPVCSPHKPTYTWEQAIEISLQPCAKCQDENARYHGTRCGRIWCEDQTVRQAAGYLENAEWLKTSSVRSMRKPFDAAFDHAVRAHFEIPEATRIKFDADSDRTCSLAALISERTELTDSEIAALLALPVGGQLTIGLGDVVERVRDQGDER